MRSLVEFALVPDRLTRSAGRNRGSRHFHLNLFGCDLYRHLLSKKEVSGIGRPLTILQVPQVTPPGRQSGGALCF